VLINAQEGRTKALRQWRMFVAADIKPTLIKRYVQQAKVLVEAGHRIPVDRKKPVVVPAELKAALSKSRTTAATFARLRVGQQREYTEYVDEAKRAETKQRRIE
jgi:uncharacterized protein YdeI (YjbR/CyaY-like superfamily)